MDLVGFGFLNDGYCEVLDLKKIYEFRGPVLDSIVVEFHVKGGGVGGGGRGAVGGEWEGGDGQRRVGEAESEDCRPPHQARVRAREEMPWARPLHTHRQDISIVGNGSHTWVGQRTVFGTTVYKQTKEKSLGS